MAVKRSRKPKVKSKTQKVELVPHKLYCPVIRFKLKRERIIGLSEDLVKGLHAFTH